MDPTEPNGIMSYLGYTDNHTDTGELKLCIHLKCLQHPQSAGKNLLSSWHANTVIPVVINAAL